MAIGSEGGRKRETFERGRAKVMNKNLLAIVIMIVTLIGPRYGWGNRDRLIFLEE